MYKLFKALQCSNDRETAYYIAKEYNNSSNNHYHLFYNGWAVLVYVHSSIYMSTSRDRCLDSSNNGASNNEASYEELLELIGIIVKASNYYTPQILDLLNSILVNWDLS